MRCYLVFRRNMHPDAIEHPLLDQHLSWIRMQHKRGTIVLSGQSTDRATGIYIMRTSSQADAIFIAASDPLAQYEQARIDVIEWDVHQPMSVIPFDSGYAEQLQHQPTEVQMPTKLRAKSRLKIVKEQES